MYLCRGFRQNILADDKWIHSGYTLYGQWPDLSSHESFFQSRRVTEWIKNKDCGWIKCRIETTILI